MKGTIEVTRIAAAGDTVRYEIRDDTGLRLLKREVVGAWVRYHGAEGFGFTFEGLPEQILAVPVTLYLLPVTWFYGVELVVPAADRTLYDALPSIYGAYSGVYGPFREEWRGKVTAGRVVGSEMPASRFDRMVFFSGGIDAVHAGIDNPGAGNVLVSVPSIEGVSRTGNAGGGIFDGVKSRLLREFSSLTGSGRLLVTNNFRSDVFDDRRIQRELGDRFALGSEAFRYDGWFGMTYLGNLLSSAPFAFAMGVRSLVMGSTFEPLEGVPAFNMDGANPRLSDAMRFAGVSFAEQDAPRTRRSAKTRHIVEWCAARGKRAELWTCFADDDVQCGKCTKCVRTQLNILCAGENPADWGFSSFDEGRFSRLVRSYRYHERNACWLWDIVDSIEEGRTYPYCDGLLHWLKRTGYARYHRRSRAVCGLRGLSSRICRVDRYPRYVKALSRRLVSSARRIAGLNRKN